MPERVAIAEAIGALRRELEEAVAAAADQNLGFELQKVELELHAGFTKTGTAKAGVKWWVVELGGEGSVESATTQIVRLTLLPRQGGTGAHPLLLERGA
ncbi:MAG: hypothetical protein LBR33_09735 [Propionibacteriaceae bacterium]|jgi:hypothetical protein|nr:hypothetical protein [Propionibacteriaceae bacterium]